MRKFLIGLSLLFSLNACKTTQPSAASDLFLQNKDTHTQVVKGTMPSSTRGLTPAEKKLCTSFFGASFQTDDINCKFKDTIISTPKGTRAALVPLMDKNNIEFFGAKYFGPDFCNDNIVNFGNFFHEVVHLWQNRINFGMTKIKPSDKDNYDYDIFASKDFTTYGAEEQAAIVQDYACRFLYPIPDKRQTIWISERYEKDSDVTDQKLADIVEKAFPEAKKLRLSMQ